MMIGRTRRGVIIGGLGVLGGCTGGSEDKAGDDAAQENPALADVGNGALELTSSAFQGGEKLPEKYGYDAENVNPPLEIDGVPDTAQALVLVVDDPDAVEPAGKIWTHWLVWNIDPGRTAIPEGWEPEDAIEGQNDFGEVGYGGPSPPDDTHRYRFKLFALDTRLDLSSGESVDALGEAMTDHVLTATQLIGTYSP